MSEQPGTSPASEHWHDVPILIESDSDTHMDSEIAWSEALPKRDQREASHVSVTYSEDCREWLRKEMLSQSHTSAVFSPEELWDMVVGGSGFNRLTQFYRCSNPTLINGEVSVKEFAECYIKLHREQQVNGEFHSPPITLGRPPPAAPGL